MKKLLLAVAAVTGLTTLTACFGEETGDTVTITDRAGREVEISTELEGIVSIAPSITGMLVDLGLEDSIVAVDQNSYAQFDFGDEIANLGSTFSGVNAEAVIAAEGQILFTSTTFDSDTDEDKYTGIFDANIPVVSSYSGDTLDNVALDVEFLGEVTNTEEKAEELVTEFNETIEAIAKIAETIEVKKNVYYEVGFYSSGIWTTGRGTFQNEMIELVGGINVFANLEGFNAVSEESIIDRAQVIDAIVVSSHGDAANAVDYVSARDGWDVMDAVENGAIHLVDKNSFSQANHKLTKGLIDLAKALFPTEYAEL